MPWFVRQSRANQHFTSIDVLLGCLKHRPVFQLRLQQLLESSLSLGAGSAWTFVLDWGLLFWHEQLHPTSAWRLRPYNDQALQRVTGQIEVQKGVHTMASPPQ